MLALVSGGCGQTPATAPSFAAAADNVAPRALPRGGQATVTRRDPATAAEIVEVAAEPGVGVAADGDRWRLTISVGKRATGLNARLADGGRIRVGLPLGVPVGVVFHPETAVTEADRVALGELRPQWSKFWVDWQRVQPHVFGLNAVGHPVTDPVTESELDRLLARAADPGLIDALAFPSLANGFADVVDWTWLDAVVTAIISAGSEPLPLVGDATTAPRLAATGRRIAPTAFGTVQDQCTDWFCTGFVGIGPDRYAAMAGLHAAALARRYRDRIGAFNLENELNWTFTHVLFAGWRVGDAWLDRGFLLRLAGSLRDGVHRGHPWALAFGHFNIHDPSFETHLPEWAATTDLVGLGGYPNYLFPDPPWFAVLDRAQAAVWERVGTAPIVAETGYPSGPTVNGYSQARQAEYLVGAWRGACAADAAGFIYFRLRDHDFGLDDRHLQAVEQHFGIVARDGARKPAFAALMRAAATGCNLSRQQTPMAGIPRSES